MIAIIWVMLGLCLLGTTVSAWYWVLVLVCVVGLFTCPPRKSKADPVKEKNPEAHNANPKVMK